MITTFSEQIDALLICGFHSVVRGSSVTVSMLDGCGFEKVYDVDTFSASVVVEDFACHEYNRGSDDKEIPELY